MGWSPLLPLTLTLSPPSGPRGVRMLVDGPRVAGRGDPTPVL
jgi:hypothetical protein